MPIATEIDRGASAAPASDSAERIARFCTRLDAHLNGLPGDTERIAFLRRQQVDWIARYELFCARVDGGQEPLWGEQASDYVLTLAEISARISIHERRAP